MQSASALCMYRPRVPIQHHPSIRTIVHVLSSIACLSQGHDTPIHELCVYIQMHLPCKQEAGAVQPCWWWPVGSLHWFRSTPSRPNSRWIQAAAGCRSGTAMDCASALLSNHSRSRCSTVDVCACLDFKKFSKKCYSRHHIESCDTYMKH